MKAAERTWKEINNNSQTWQDTPPPTPRKVAGYAGGKVDEERKQVERGMQPLLTMDGMLFLAPGGMSTRRSGLRLFMPRFMGGGDLVCMFLFMPPGETSRPGELRWFPYPFPKREHRKKAEKHLIHQCSPLVFLGRRTYMLLNLCQKFNESQNSCCPWRCDLIMNYRNPFSPCTPFQCFCLIFTSCGRKFISAPSWREDL